METLNWEEGGKTQTARWRSEAGVPPHKRVIVADDRIAADAAYKLACEGTALLWR
ncbi:MAG TPA: methyltransferase, partial [Noviherbaspirillum sp.]|nr:methyltransferase [Noviherbaspirillum sp.]